MLSKKRINEIIKHSEEKIFFYIESRFWSKPNMSELQSWMSNFKTLEEKYCAMKLLDRFVYYSEEDIIRLIDFGLNEKIFSRHLLNLEISTGFKLKDSEITQHKKDFFKKTIFLPLPTGNLSDSSFAMLRYLTNNIGVPEERILNPEKLNSETLNNIDTIVIIDDFIGSGKQLNDFWNFKKINLDGKEINFKEIKDSFTKINIEYFCLVCTEEGYDYFKYNDDVEVNNNLRVTYAEMLTNKFKVFSSDSIYFDNEEIEECQDILQKVCAKNGIDFLGYNGLDYAVAFHHSIPDCSLPLFYRSTNNWKYLHRNKKTISNE